MKRRPSGKKGWSGGPAARYGERGHHFRLALHLDVMAFVPFRDDVLVQGCMKVT